MSALHVAVDARDLKREWRGIARYLRAVLKRFEARTDVTVTLVEPGWFGQRAPRGTDVVWHPWNGTFFRSTAPSVVTFHDAVPFRFAAADARKRKNEQDPWLRSAASAHSFLANSCFTVSEVETFLHVAADRQTVTYLAVEHDVFRPDGPANALHDGRPFVLFAGTSEPLKNLGTLLAAHAKAFPGDEVALVMAGGEPPEGARLVSLGAIEPAELAAWYRGASAVAVPSLYECFGLPLLESLACGTPAIATGLPSLREVGGDAPLWVDDPLDVDAWTAALLRVVSDAPYRDAARAAGVERAAMFSWDRCAEKTLAVLRRTAESG